jgi:hypothetical protein
MAKKSRKNIIDEVTSTELIQHNSKDNLISSDFDLSKTDTQLRIEEEAIRVSVENSNLEDKLAEYIDKVEKLTLENNTLKSINAKLQEDIERYLTNINQLSFDNALLKSTVDNLTVSTELHSDVQSSITNEHTQLQKSQNISLQPSTSVKYSSLNKRYKKNGYSDWN